MRLLLLPLLLLCSLLAAAQTDSLYQVPGVPSREVYDLLRDHNGFLWMAHNAGISRYDGQRIMSFGNPRQNGRAMTDLCEDRHGRIWCHNFEGQILYIEHNKLQVLEAFRYNEESTFPRIGLLGDELVSSSSKGLFTCNTRTLECHYYELPFPTASITVLSNGVLAWMPGINRGFWWYQKGKGIRHIACSLRLPQEQEAALQAESLNDTAYFVINPQGTYYKLRVSGDSVQVSEAQHAGSFINTITIDRGELWVHTNSTSRSSKGQVINNQALTNALSDVQGHSFFSSLRRGLLAATPAAAALRVPPFLEKGDYIRTLSVSAAGTELFGTQQGYVYLRERGRIAGKFRLDPSFRAVQKFYALNDSLYLVTTATGLHRLNLHRHQMYVLDSFVQIRDISIKGNRAVIATSYGVLELTPAELATARTTSYAHPFNQDWRRTRTACLGPDGTLFASFNSGLFYWRGRDSGNLFFEGTRLYTTRVRNFAGKVLIATFNKGLLQYDSGRLKTVLSMPEGMANAVPEMKVSGSTAWVVYEDQVQELDPQLHVRDVNGLPFRGAEVLDLLERPDSLVVATEKGLYLLPRHSGPGITATHSVIDNIRVNDSAGNVAGRSSFRHQENTFSIDVATPWFAGQDRLRYRYRLCSREDSNCAWLMSDEGQRSFAFINLPPGSYTFSAEAVNTIGTPLAPEVSYSFTIDPPWWGTWWARLLMVALLTTLFFLLGLYGQRRRARRQRTRYEKMLAVEHERQRISAEIHDDL
ncbi:MAG: hypothetical protein EOO16_21990, partial [Chitinophagaceae bacterium]